MQSLKKNRLAFEQWHEEFSKFWSNNQKSQNLYFNGLPMIKVYNFWANKVQRRSLDWITYWRSVQALKEKWSVVALMTWGIWWTSLEHSKILKLEFSETFFCKIYSAELKNFRWVLCHDTEGWCMFKEKLTGGLKIDIRNLVNFHGSSQKSKDLHFDGFLLSIAYKVPAKKV